MPRRPGSGGGRGAPPGAAGPGTGERPSLRRIAAELARRGLLAPGGRPYLPGSVAAMLGPAPRRTGPVPARPAGGEADR